MKRGIQGSTVTVQVPGESFRAFVPRPLPPDPPLQMDAELQDLLERSSRELGRLDGLSRLLADSSFFLYLYVRKEALLSSQIEGTQSSLSDLLLYETGEAPGVPLGDVEEVSRYVEAMSHGLARLRGGLPLSVRLICEVHGVLLSSGRGSAKSPGELRTSQNWVGGSRPGNAVFVPPPAHEVLRCLGDLELFLNDVPGRTPTLVKAGLAHAQFETIHPFLDGNGRLGRLLVTLLLCAEGALTEPLLYLSLFLKQNRQQYYDELQRVRLEGDWEEWLRFFLRAVETTAREATQTASRILSLFESDRKRIEGLGRAAGTALRVHQALSRRPLTSIPQAARELGLTYPTVAAALGHLSRLGIVHELTGRARGKLYVYREYLDLLSEGTDPL